MVASQKLNVTIVWRSTHLRNFTETHQV